MSFLVCTSKLSKAGVTFYRDEDKVFELTEKIFKEKVIASKEPWIIEFYAPWCGHCQNLVTEWKKVALALEGIIKVGAINAEKYKSLQSEYQISSFPTIKFFGGNKLNPTVYTETPTADNIVDFSLREIGEIARSRLGKGKSSGGSAKHVVELSDSNFDGRVLKSKKIIFVEFYAPWCGHCKQLAPHYELAAKRLHEKNSKVRFAAVDATVNSKLATKYDIRGYPTILIFGADKTKSPNPYTSGRDADSLVEAALSLEASTGTAAEVTELISEAIFMEYCNPEKQVICLIAILPHISFTEAKGRNRYLDAMKQVNEEMRGKPFRFLWTEVGKQSSLEQSLHLDGVMLPTMVALSLKKLKYTRYTRAFDTEHLRDYCQHLLIGMSEASNFDPKLLKINSVAPWDGKDYQRKDEL
ncbi:hypothetical protein Zmor_008919 [Zophobas morio]|uniref:protein disulfide-isomerase n=1 Tax=Zophobas morio TaxID=2755281 RepID=A0AA38M0I5_9CUCU|nr:hypothetical protein Zmor_008919 [Zophobas morio]